MQEYQVVITGVLLGETTREQALTSLREKLKLPQNTAEQLLSGNPRVVKKNIDEKTALQFQQRFEQMGVGCSIMPMKKPPVAPPPVEWAEQAIVEAKKAAPAPGRQQSNNGKVITSPLDHPGFQFTIEGRPDYSFLTVRLPANETLKVEASAMATMDTNIRMKTKLKGGLGRFLTGESLFINEFTAEGGQGEIGIAPGPPGDLINYYLKGDDTIYLQNSAFVASAMGVNLETKWQGLAKGFFSGENLFLIRCTGTGDLWFNTYGAMIPIDVSGDYVVDTGHIVAFTEGLDYKVTKVGGYKSLFFSGEGFVCRFSGKGRVWVQTRMANALISWVHPYRPVKKGS